MQTITDPDVARDWVFQQRAAGKTVGLVPTMGALHDGHLSLVQTSRKQCDATIATIFINPTQFAPTEDLDKYPRTLKEDCERLAGESVDAVFVPETKAMYTDHFSTYVDPPQVAHSLEGVCRPEHFRGVATIVLKLFQIAPATHAFFGQKDYQQLQVIRAMVRDLNVGIQIVAGETIREPDGLAMSSRNRYLSVDDRRRALLISRSLQLATDLYHTGEKRAAVLQDAMQQHLLGRPADRSEATPLSVDKIDYAVVVDAETLQEIDTINQTAVALIATMVGNTRLIDNRLIVV
ncbi:pantoate--beta-alanine ligase [Planctomycetes bacterium K23_9]|uniref:Pantothenate synthetase n=1 Tax=Stieleria marina TaxID=1930275 RepID=A0A517NWW4_9BACT|nr:Pantoate-beta-alanine ligase [Planctomycetes bacterium K23_9]